MELSIELAQKQILTQHMVQSMEILQMNTMELTDYVENMAMENPVIELEDRNVSETDMADFERQKKLEWLSSSSYDNKIYYRQGQETDYTENDWQDKTAKEETLSEYLMSQLILDNFSQHDLEILNYMTLSLDHRGYYTDDLSVVMEQYHISESHAEMLLKTIQSLEPAGVCARNLEECLMIQVKRKGIDNDVLDQMIQHHLSDIERNHLPDIAKKLSVPLESVIEVCQVIRELNPKPGSCFSNRDHLKYISPDAVVIKLKDSFEVLINEYQYPSFSINQYYQKLAQKTDDKETRRYLREKIQQAQQVAGCIENRTSTLSKVMHVLVEMQSEFFMYGIGHKKPMKLSDLADVLDMHESTISRTLRSKYLQCAWGVFPLNYFLTSVVSRSSDAEEGTTPEKVKNYIQQIIDGENKKKPYSDQVISRQLQAHGIFLSRRTVNKYRMEMGIPDKVGRRDWGIA